MYSKLCVTPHFEALILEARNVWYGAWTLNCSGNLSSIFIVEFIFCHLYVCAISVFVSRYNSVNLQKLQKEKHNIFDR